MASGFLHRPIAHIAVVAPSSPFDAAGFERGVARLRGRYEVSYEPDILTKKGFLAGDDARRLGELRAALASPRVDVVMAARGGYGATRIAQLVAADEVRRHAPLLVGFSDVSALHAVWAHAGVSSLHGSMVAALGSVSEPQFARFCAALEGRFPERFEGLATIVPGVAEGVLLGGNLAVLCALLGTPVFPPLTDAVLFLEDIGERPYRVDRMLTSMRNAGVLQGVRGIVLGAFEQGEPGADGVTLQDVLRERTRDLGVPVVSGFPAGHVDDNQELPFGWRVTIDARTDTSTLHIHSAE
ncbi:MAG TPA: LD-carboxypeptidase [Polyangiales bacterium]|nr:LD-carboxypeptidase [Polyangiales bacterium]